MSFPSRSLGRNGPHVPAVGLGLMSLGGIYGAAGSLDEKLAFLDHAHATGQQFWDTADIYGDCEDVVGEWFKRSGKRNDIFLATKFAIQLDPQTGVKVCSEPEYVQAACEKSLQRLGVNTIDLYYCHRVDGVTPVEKTIEAMIELKHQGKIRHLGISEVTASTLRRAHALHPIAALQMEYSPFALDIESPQLDLLRTCRELGVAVVAYSPMGRGILTGEIQSFTDFPEDDMRRMLPKYSPENFPKILQLIDGLKQVAHAHQATPGQIAIAWLLAQGPEVIAIPGTKSTRRLDENARSALLRLTVQEMQDIRELVERTEIVGARYGEIMQSLDIGETPEL
ncbi:Aldo/keto reductase [Penicillium capsulatum]|uniref:Aldo/keto reductase n=1 Tax=Penicillium capsulatum TaxID=69766 RepID=A0A9W9LKR5_9EURO|nr:Aldo/keto reductase [Penicillium capsulatum]KAJ6116691.1 Aldo/keto reductase [Penicillium capsulatum]